MRNFNSEDTKITLEANENDIRLGDALEDIHVSGDKLIIEEHPYETGYLTAQEAPETGIIIDTHPLGRGYLKPDSFNCPNNEIGVQALQDGGRGDALIAAQDNIAADDITNINILSVDGNGEVISANPYISTDTEKLFEPPPQDGLISDDVTSGLISDDVTCGLTGLEDALDKADAVLAKHAKEMGEKAGEKLDLEHNDFSDTVSEANEPDDVTGTEDII